MSQAPKAPQKKGAPAPDAQGEAPASSGTNGNGTIRNVGPKYLQGH
jgi:hypothetical protein